MQTKIILVLLSFVMTSYGNELSGLVRRFLGLPNFARPQGRYGESYGLFPKMLLRNERSGLEDCGGIEGRNDFGNSFRVSVNVECNPQTPYVDENQQRCYCEDNCIICPDNGGNSWNNQMTSCQNQCGGITGGSFQQDCNICFCTDIGQICSSNQC